MLVLISMPQRPSTQAKNFQVVHVLLNYIIFNVLFSLPLIFVFFSTQEVMKNLQLPLSLSLFAWHSFSLSGGGGSAVDAYFQVHVPPSKKARSHALKT